MAEVWVSMEIAPLIIEREAAVVEQTFEYPEIHSPIASLLLAAAVEEPYVHATAQTLQV